MPAPLPSTPAWPRTASLACQGRLKHLCGQVPGPGPPILVFTWGGGGVSGVQQTGGSWREVE